jgi:hypothetical protein
MIITTVLYWIILINYFIGGIFLTVICMFNNDPLFDKIIMGVITFISGAFGYIIYNYDIL